MERGLPLPHMRGPAFAEGLALSAAALWGTSWVATAFALREADSLGVAFFRGVTQFALLALAVLVLRTRHSSMEWARMREGLNRRQLVVLVTLGLLGGAFTVGQSLAVELGGASLTAVVATQYPLIAILLAPFVLGERINRGAVSALAVVAAGVFLLAAPVVADAHRLAGIAVAAAAAMSFGAYLVLARRMIKSHDLPPLAATLAVFAGVAVLSSPAVLSAATSFNALGGTTWLALAWLVVMAGILPLALTEVAIRSAPAVQVAPFFFLTPLVGAGLGAIWLGEPLTPLQLAGGAFAIAGLAAATALSSAPVMEQ